jgi:hypothetical protein
MSCSLPFLLDGSPISACNTSRHRLKRDRSISGVTDFACLLLPIGENTGLRDPSQDAFIGFMQSVTY